jgi:hypothetical protein
VVECQIVVMKDVYSSPLGAAFEHFCKKESDGLRKIPGSGRISLPESPVPEIIGPVFAKTSPKRSFSMTEYERFGLVFTKTRV